MLPLTFALIAVATCLPAADPKPETQALPLEPKAAQAFTANELYARQTRRRIAHYLRLRLLELHQAKLERVSKVVRGELSIDELLREP